jgi:hypothetical protein
MSCENASDSLNINNKLISIPFDTLPRHDNAMDLGEFAAETFECESTRGKIHDRRRESFPSDDRAFGGEKTFQDLRAI